MRGQKGRSSTAPRRPPLPRPNDPGNPSFRWLSQMKSGPSHLPGPAPHGVLGRALGLEDNRNRLQQDFDVQG